MLVVQLSGQRPGFSIDRQRVAGHARHVFQNHKRLWAAAAALAPQQNGACPATSTAGIASESILANVRQIAAPVSEFVIARDLGLTQTVRDRNRPMKIIRVRCSEARNRCFGLRPGGGKF